MSEQVLIPHLFRTEFSKIVAVLTRHLGMAHLQTAEDITSDTFLAAVETWPYKGLPANPVAWLYAVAKNKAINIIRREKIFHDKILPRLDPEGSEPAADDIDLSGQNITDSQLKMLFSLCHPALSKEAQIGLALRILCGFGIVEIATAFLQNKETINKRLSRAREKLRSEAISINVIGKQEMAARLDAVLTTLYLLFNEGYHSETNDLVLREDLCLEAMRLVYLLIENEHTNQPKVRALLALMCFHASRFEARKGINGDIILYEQQDTSRWDYELIAKGAYYLKQAADGPEISKYHLEAAIAYWHTVREDSKEKWQSILHLYDQLLAMEYSVIAALNRAFVIFKIHGNKRAIAEAEALGLTGNACYHALLGELYSGVETGKATFHFKAAILLAKTHSDRQTLQKKLHGLVHCNQ